MFSVSVGLSIFLSAAISAQLTSPLGPVVDLRYAAFAGNSTPPDSPTNPDIPAVGPVTFFGGIPYAQPPLGDLRWRAPRKLNEEENPERVVTDARNWGPPCIQQPAVVGIGSEGHSNRAWRLQYSTDP